MKTGSPLQIMASGIIDNVCHLLVSPFVVLIWVTVRLPGKLLMVSISFTGLSKMSNTRYASGDWVHNVRNLIPRPCPYRAFCILVDGAPSHATTKLSTFFGSEFCGTLYDKIVTTYMYVRELFVPICRCMLKLCPLVQKWKLRYGKYVFLKFLNIARNVKWTNLIGCWNWLSYCNRKLV
jgi:hypothetical protein